MYLNWGASRVGLIAVCLIVSGASLSSAAQPKKRPNAQLTAVQKKLRALEGQIQKQNDQIVDLLAFIKRPLEIKMPVDIKARIDPALEAQIQKQNDQIIGLISSIKTPFEIKSPVEVKARVEPAETSSEQRLEQRAPVVSAAIALTAALIAALAYWANRRSSSNTHMHGVFRDYLKLRFDYHQKVQEKTEDQRKLLTAVPLDNEAKETLPQQLGGIELYALEEMYVWTNTWTSKLSAKIFPSQKDIREAWQNTIKLHIQLYPKDVEANLVRFPECYGIKFLEFAEPVLNSPEVTEVVKKQLACYRACGKRPAGKWDSYPPVGSLPAASAPSGSASGAAGSGPARNPTSSAPT